MLFKLNLLRLFVSNSRLIGRIFLYFLLLYSALSLAWEQKYFNLHPDNDDVVLPMPCDGSTVFRKVTVPVGKPIDDYAINLGGTDEDWDFVENTRKDYIAGSFKENNGSSYYLIGKYEINQLQYAAVMEKECPKVSMKGRLAQNKVNWFESIDFTNKYNLWLLQHAKNELPLKDNKHGYVRLPTETEWEYAARGGIKIPSSSFQERLFPMEEDIKQYVWISGTQSANGKVKFTGLLKPNPLQIYDILGNVDEIVLNSFRLNKLTREHGQAGGFVVRGGNFLTSEASMRTAIRQEVPYYIEAGLRKSETTGFRIVLGSSILTSSSAIDDYQKAWRGLGKNIIEPAVQTKIGEKSLDNPVDELQTITKAVTDKNMRKRLQNLIQVLRGSIEAKSEQTSRAARSALRLGYFLCKGLSDNIIALRPAKKRYQSSCIEKVQNEGYCKLASDKISLSEKNIKKTLNYYADTIPQTALDYSKSTLDEQKNILIRVLNERKLNGLIKYLEVYRKHLNQFVANGMMNKEGWLKECVPLGNND